MTVSLQVMIPTAGRPQLVQRTLESLTECTKPVGYLGARVIENGPASGARQVVAEFSDSGKTTYEHFAMPGKSGALNDALQDVVDDTLIVFFDDDVRISADTLMAYDCAASKSPLGYFFGGPTGADYDKPPPPWLVEHLPASARGWSRSEPGPVKLPVFLGFNWAAYAGDLKRIGGFDTRFGPGNATIATGQETDAQSRLLEVGLTGVYVPDAMVWHYVPTQRCSTSFAIERQRRNAFHYGMREPVDLRERVRWRINWMRAFRRLALGVWRGPQWRTAARIEMARYAGFLDGQRSLRR